MKGYTKPVSCNEGSLYSGKPVSVGQAFANGFAKGMKGGIADIREKRELKSVRVFSVQRPEK